MRRLQNKKSEIHQKGRGSLKFIFFKKKRMDRIETLFLRHRLEFYAIGACIAIYAGNRFAHWTLSEKNPLNNEIEPYVREKNPE
jgi:hypothetical protein